MNKNVKFIAWEKNLKEVIEVRDIDFKSNLINTGGIWRYLNEVELLQYTGFKDKNGKEIYDGHVLHNEDYWPIRIEYDNGSFMVRDLDEVRYNNKCLNCDIRNFDISKWEITDIIYNVGEDNNG